MLSLLMRDLVSADAMSVVEILRRARSVLLSVSTTVTVTCFFALSPTVTLRQSRTTCSFVMRCPNLETNKPDPIEPDFVGGEGFVLGFFLTSGGGGFGVGKVIGGVVFEVFGN